MKTRTIWFIGLLWVGLAGTAMAASDMFLTIGGTRYQVATTGVLAKTCTLRSLQVLSPRDPLMTDGKSFPVSRVRKGEVLGDVTLVGKGETFPFSFELREVLVTDAAVRQDGTWSMTIAWKGCAQNERVSGAPGQAVQ